MVGLLAGTKTHKHLTRLAIISASGAAATALMAPAYAAASTSHNSFHGSCSIVGNEAASGTSSVFHGHGTCIGTLNGGRVMPHHVVEVIREAGTVGAGGHMMPAMNLKSSGTGSLSFGTGKVVRFAIQQSLGRFTVEGARAGMGSGSVTTASRGALRLAMTTCGGALAG